MTLREALEDMYVQHGKLTPALLVHEARNPEHPLHSTVFNKTPEDAAEAYFLDRAHRLIASVKIKYRDRDEKSPTRYGRAFIAVPTPDEPTGIVYRAAEDVITDEFSSRIVLQQMERQWKTLYRTWHTYGEFADLVGTIQGDLADFLRALQAEVSTGLGIDPDAELG